MQIGFASSLEIDDFTQPLLQQQRIHGPSANECPALGVDGNDDALVASAERIRAVGRFTSSDRTRSGAVTMKMISSTSTTSTKGVTFDFGEGAPRAGSPAGAELG